MVTKTTYDVYLRQSWYRPQSIQHRRNGFQCCQHKTSLSQQHSTHGPCSRADVEDVHSGEEANHIGEVIQKRCIIVDGDLTLSLGVSVNFGLIVVGDQPSPKLLLIDTPAHSWLAHLFAMRECDQAVGCHQIRIAFVPAVGLIDPASVFLLKRGKAS